MVIIMWCRLIATGQGISKTETDHERANRNDVGLVFEDEVGSK